MDYKTKYRNGPGFNKPFIGIPIIKIIWSVTRQFYLYDGNSYYGKTAILSIQSSAVIMWSNIVTYYTNNYRNWGRILIRCWIHKRHPIPHPNGRDMGCLSWIFVRKLTTALHCISIWMYYTCVPNICAKQFPGWKMVRKGCHKALLSPLWKLMLPHPNNMLKHSGGFFYQRKLTKSAKSFTNVSETT